MNTRQLSQGLIPTPEYERHHTYHSLRQFPELRRTVNDIQLIKLRSSLHSNSQSHSQGGINRIHSKTSTHRLDELSKSCVDEINAMTEFRQVLLDNRRRMKQITRTDSVGSLASLNGDDLTISTLNISPAEAADRKLTKVSVSFDSQSYNSHLAGFSGAKLAKEEFYILLRRCLNITLKKVEQDALFEKMDVDGSGLIDGVEFVRYFFALGKQARAATHHETMERRNKRMNDEKAKVSEKMKRIKEWESSQISNFTEKDMVSVMRKLEDAAFKWDHTNYIESMYVKGFEVYLTPYDFKQQIERSFKIRLTGAEIGALLQRFSTHPGKHCVDGYSFIKRFCELRDKTREEYIKAQDIYRVKKERVMKMGQHTDILPKLLGR